MAKLVTDEDTMSFIRNHFSVKNEGAFFAKKKGHRFVKDRKYAITPSGLFQFGMYVEIVKFLVKSQITDIKYTDNFKTYLKCGFGEFEIVNNLIHEERYYQGDGLKAALTKGRGIIEHGTGAGKSLLQALLIDNFIRLSGKDNFKCLLIVPGTSLVAQLHSDFSEYGVSFSHSMWSGKNPLQDTTVVICNTENLTAKFNNSPWIKDVDLAVVDECHGVNTDANLEKWLSKIHTPNKYGFTGTLSDKVEDQWKAFGMFGGVIHQKKSKELRDEGYLTNVSVKIIKFIHTSKPPSNEIKGYLKEMEYIYNHEGRNDTIRKLSNNIKGNQLIMVNHLLQGDNLRDKLKDNTNDLFYITGEMPVSERFGVIKKMEESDNNTTISMSKIFSTGINIKNLPNIMLVGLGKGFIRLVQTIGRGLRLHDNKEKLTIIDVYDNMKYSERHMEKRKEIYEKESISWKEVEINI